MLPLVNPRRTAEILKQYHFKPSKTLGQNFLVDTNILLKMLNAAELNPNDIVLEVGAGIGTLTEALAAQVKLVIAFEYDRKLLEILEDTLKTVPNVKVISADALRFNFSQLPSSLPFPNKMVSNLPYQIASPLLVQMLERYPQIARYVVMVQKEVAERIMASPGSKDYSALTLKIQYFTEIKFIANVSRKVFIPQPKVDSAIILLKRLEKPRVKVKDDRLLFKIVTASFEYRRKMIKNALFQASFLNLSKEEIEEALRIAEVNGKLRGEQLTLYDFGRLSDAFVLLQKES